MAQELKAFKLGSAELGEYWAYDAEEVDAVLAEKDKEIERLDDLAHAHNVELLRKENLIAEKDAEIRRLKELKDKYSSCAEKAINGIAKCELKTYDFPVDHGDFTSTVELFYLKSEADKVIADLEESHKKEVSQLLILNREQANSANRLRDSMEQVIRRHKHNRCLAMAKWCYAKWDDTATKYYKSVWYRKWEVKWIALAEKFKEA